MFKVTDACVACGLCAANCPAGAISEKDGKMEINQEVCAQCGLCAANCPAGAIVEE